MPSINDLPPEVRNRIWSLCLPADEPEIYFYNRYDFSPAERWPTCRVIIARPPILHVCRESAMLRKKLSFTGARHRDGGIVKVPYRPYRPLMDAVYISIEELEYITDALAAADTDHKEFFRDLTHLALESPCFFQDNWWTARRLLHSVTNLPALRTISMVFGKTWLKPYRPTYPRYPKERDPDMTPEDWKELEECWDKWERTVEPPFSLEEWTDKNALLVDGDSRDRIDQQELLRDIEAVLSSHLAGASNDHVDNHERVQGTPSKVVRLDREINLQFSKLVTRKYSLG